MNKKVSFFDGLYNVIVSIAIYILMIGIAFVLVSISYFSHENERITYDDSIICIDSSIDSVSGYQDDNNVYIYLELKEEQTKEQILAYGYAYMDYYKKNVYLECVNKYTYIFVTVCLDGTSSIV